MQLVLKTGLPSRNRILIHCANLVILWILHNHIILDDECWDLEIFPNVQTSLPICFLAPFTHTTQINLKTLCEPFGDTLDAQICLVNYIDGQTRCIGHFTHRAYARYVCLGNTHTYSIRKKQYLMKSFFYTNCIKVC